MTRPTTMCQFCGVPVDRLQRSAPRTPGLSCIYISYPCMCWHTEEQAEMSDANTAALPRQAYAPSVRTD